MNSLGVRLLGSGAKGSLECLFMTCLLKGGYKEKRTRFASSHFLDASRLWRHSHSLTSSLVSSFRGSSTALCCRSGTLNSFSGSALRQSVRFIVVEKSETPNPDCMRLFSMEASFLKAGATLDVPSRDYAHYSLLAQRLFEAIPQLIGVFLADEYITIRKSEDAPWEEIVSRASEIVASFVESGEPILSPEGEKTLVQYYDDTNAEEGDDEVILAVKELLATRIRPMLVADGGNVRYIDMDDGTVFLLLEGACQTCPSSHITLKSGIERMLMHWIPEVVEAVEVSQDVALELLQAKRSRAEKQKVSKDA